jgi:hypothetical protein
MFRSLSFGVFATGLVCTNAFACFSPSNQSTIFFRDVPPTIEASAIAQVTVVELTDTRANRGIGQYDGYRTSYAGLARIDRVIKGTIGDYVIRLVAPTSSCDQPFRVGETGIVIGNIRHSTSNVPEFVALSESFHERRLREQSRLGAKP